MEFTGARPGLLARWVTSLNPGSNTRSQVNNETALRKARARYTQSASGGYKE